MAITWPRSPTSRVAARVGSRMSDTRDVIQVRLHKGETVEVIEPRRNGHADDKESQAWYKIAPPAGEFRWVSGRYVDPDYEPRRRAADRGRRSRRSDRPGHRPLAGRLRRAAAVFTGAISRRQLDQIDLELSTMVVDDPNFWELSELSERAETLFNQSETALERGRARMLVSKIAQFEEIKRRKQALAAFRPELARPDQPAVSLLPPADPDGRFDAKGQLIRVPDPKPGGPQYAILDASGNIRCYVSPAPGVNLRSYVGRQVGINGIRGYMPEQRATHVMARHVSVVEGTQLK